MSTGTFYAVAAASVGGAVAVALVGIKALRQSRTVEVFERQPQQYMVQANPASGKLHTLEMPMRRQLDRQFAHEKQA